MIIIKSDCSGVNQSLGVTATKDMTKSKPSIIQSLDKGLFLLEIIEQGAHPYSLQELWRELRWDKATIYRLLSTLEGRGYVRRHPESRRYSLGIKIYALYDSLVRHMDLQQTIRPYLSALVRQTGQTAHLAVPAGSRIVFIDRAVGSDILSVNTQIGAAEPLHCTALGKAYLAFCEPKQRDELIAGRLTRFTPRTLVSRAELTDECERTRKRGYALDDEEYIEGVRCLAAPVLNAQAVPVALVGVSGAKDRIRGKTIREYGETIRRVSLEISAAFGYGVGTNPGSEPAALPPKKGRRR